MQVQLGRPMTILSGTMQESEGCVVLLPTTINSQQVQEVVKNLNDDTARNVRATYDEAAQVITMVRTDSSKPILGAVAYVWAVLGYSGVATVSFLSV